MTFRVPSRAFISRKVQPILEPLEDRRVPAIAMPLVASPGGGDAKAVIYDTKTETVRAWIQPFGPNVTSFRCACGDVNGDAVADYIFGTAAGYPPRVVAIDGVTLNVQRPLFSKYVFPVNFMGGVFVAAINYDGTGPDEIVVGAGPGGGPHVKLFDLSTNPLLSFYAFNPNYSGGVSVAGNDLDNNGYEEIVTGSATTASTVKVFEFNPVTKIIDLEQSFNAYPGFNGGINIAVGNLIPGDTTGQIIVATASSPGFRPVMSVFTMDGTKLASMPNYFSATNGMTVGTIDPSGSGTQNIVTGPGRWTDRNYFQTNIVFEYTFAGNTFTRVKSYYPYGIVSKHVVFVG